MTMETHRKNSMEKTGYIRKSGPGNSVFMMEMIMVVFFFALSVSVCISMFVKADSMSRLAADINKAVTKAETIGEIFKAGELEHYRNYPETERGKVRKTDSYLFGWDEEWNPSEASIPERWVAGTDWEDFPAYYGSVRVSREKEGKGFLETAAIDIMRTRDMKSLYELEVSVYTCEEGVE